MLHGGRSFRSAPLGTLQWQARWFSSPATKGMLITGSLMLMKSLARVEKGYWHNAANQKEFLDKLSQDWNLNQVCKW